MVKRINYPGTNINNVYIKDGSIYILASSPSSPPSLFTLDYLMGIWDCKINQNKTLEKNLISSTHTYSSYDKLTIESTFLKSNNPNGHVIVWSHGGPRDRVKNSFQLVFHYLTCFGFDIFIPNFRGSTGYGKEFESLVNKDWGYGPMMDVLEGLEFLKNNGIVSTDKFIFCGESYGGYLSLLIGSRNPTKTKAVLNFFGPADLVEFIKSAPNEWKPHIKSWIGPTVDDEDALKSISPLSYLENINFPVLSVYGNNDRRVSESSIKSFMEKIESGYSYYKNLSNLGHGINNYYDFSYLSNYVFDFFISEKLLSIEVLNSKIIN